MRLALALAMAAAVSASSAAAGEPAGTPPPRSTGHRPVQIAEQQVDDLRQRQNEAWKELEGEQ